MKPAWSKLSRWPKSWKETGRKRRSSYPKGIRMHMENWCLNRFLNERRHYSSEIVEIVSILKNKKQKNWWDGFLSCFLPWLRSLFGDYLNQNKSLFPIILIGLGLNICSHSYNFEVVLRSLLASLPQSIGDTGISVYLKRNLAGQDNG